MKRFSIFLLLLLLVVVPVTSVDSQLIVGQQQLMFNYRGNWSSTLTYNSNDAVRGSDGKLYVAVEEFVPANQDPTTVARYWAEATSAAGPRGSQGERGLTGATGDDGNSITVVFFDSSIRPSPSGASYDGTTFTPPTGSTGIIPITITNRLWAQFYRLRNNPTVRLDNLGLAPLTGPRGPPGTDGTNGQDGQDGQDGAAGQDGQDGTDGDNGQSSQIVYRKTVRIELLAADAPSVTYDGTSLSLPSIAVITAGTSDNNVWQETPYISKIHGYWNLHANNTSPQDIDVDVGVQPNQVYVLDDAGQHIYRYNVDGTYISRLTLDATNDTAEALDVHGSVVRVLDTRPRGSGMNQYNQVFVYNKDGSGRQTNLEFRVPMAASPLLKGITVQGSSIYIVTETSIRRFNLSSRMEETTGVLNNLRSSPVAPSDNIDPEGSDANDYYFFTIDPTRGKVFVRDINTLSLRHLYREWNLNINDIADGLSGSITNDPKGIAVNDNEVFIINIKVVDGTTYRRVYRYYNPDNILWGSALRINNNSPYPVTSTAPFDMTGQRGEETITVQGTGTGRDGADGTDGRGVTVLYREVTKGSSAPLRPAGGTPSGYDFSALPENWHDTEDGAKRAFGAPGADGDIYISIVKFSNPNTVDRYGDPIKLTGDTGAQGPRGLPGTASAAGNSVEFIYRLGATEPTTPLGTEGTFVASTRTFTPPSGWSVNPPATVPQGQNLYIVEAVLPGEGTSSTRTITYRDPTTIPRGPKGDTGDVGARGPQGNPGVAFRMIFQEASAAPSLPTTGSWNGTTFRAPSGWLVNTPTRTDQDPENLYATGVELPSGGGTPHYTGVFRMNGLKGDKGDPGDPGAQGTRGDGTELIFHIGSSPPVAPANGSGTWNPITDTYTPPTDWTLDSSTYTGTNNLYTVKVTLPGLSTTETYGTVFRLNGQRGTVGPRGPPGPPGTATAGGNDGDTLTAIYRTSSNPDDGNIIGERPTGGMWVPATDTYTPPSNWLRDIPDPLPTNDFVFMSIVTLDGHTNAISYDLPVRLTGRKGDTGTAGTDGNPGAAGADGDPGPGVVVVYRNTPSSQTTAPTIATSGSAYVRATNSISGLDPNWSPTYTANSAMRTWVIVVTVDSSGTLSYSTAIPFTGPRGQRGQQGIAGVGGGGANGDSVRVIFNRATEEPTAPTGGSWTRNTGTLVPPSGWHNTESDATGSGRLYASIVEVSGQNDAVISYSPAIPFEGPQGPRGPQGVQGPRGATGPAGPKGDTGQRGTAGQRGKFFIPYYQWSTSQPSDPTPGRYDGGFIHNLSGWERDPPSRPNNTEQLWEALIEVNSDNSTTFVTMTPSSGPSGPRGADGNPGPAGPQGNPGPAGPQGNPGTNGTNGRDGTNGTDGTSGDNGNSTDVVYRYSTGTIRLPPSGGTAANGEIRTAPDGWSTTVPTAIAGETLYISIATIRGSDNSISYDEPFATGDGGGTAGIDSRTELTKFDILADSDVRNLYSTKVGNRWLPYNGSSLNQPGWSNIRGNFGSSSNVNVANIRYVLILDDLNLRSIDPTTAGFRGVPRNVGYRPIRITPSTNARATAGQTPRITIIGTIDRTSLQPADALNPGSTPNLNFPQTYTFPVENGAVQPIITTWEYSNVTSAVGVNFADGTADLEFVEGIQLTSDGVYAFELQINSQLKPPKNTSGNDIARPKHEFNVGEIRTKLVVEESDGTEVKSFDLQPHDFDLVIPGGDRQEGGEDDAANRNYVRTEFADYLTTVPQSFTEGDLVYFSYWFAGNSGQSSSARMVLGLTDNDQIDSHLTIYKYTQGSGGGGTGQQGPPGESVLAIWTRSVGIPNTPNANNLGIDSAGRFTSLSSDGVTWFATPPNMGTGVNYKQYLGVQGTTIRIIGSPQIDDGSKGDKGNGVLAIWTVVGSRPNALTTTDFRFDSNGNLIDAVDAASNTWSLVPSEPTGGFSLWRQMLELNISTSPPSYVLLGPVQQDLRRGIQGIQGTAGEGGSGVRVYFRRTMTNSVPTTPQIRYQNGVWTDPFPEDWAHGTIPTRGGNFRWKVEVSYQEGVNGTIVSAPIRLDAEVGYQYFYHANTANTVTAPRITYDGSTFDSIESGWATTIPTSPAGANVFNAPVRFQLGISGQTVEGVVLFGTVPGAVTPPPGGARTYTIFYGLVVGNAESNVQSFTISLAAGGTYVSPNYIAWPRTTSNQQNAFFRISPTTDLNGTLGPSGVQVNAQFSGDITSLVTGTLATRYVIPIGAADQDAHYILTIRRNP